MKTRYSRRVWAGFELVFRPWMRRRLDGIHVRGLDRVAWLPDLPVLLVANHVSWWDGFLLREVHRRMRPDAPLHVVMTEGELRRFPIFRWMGAVPLSDGRLAARGLLRDLEARASDRRDAVFAYFPQGRIWPSHRRPLGFRPGVSWHRARVVREGVTADSLEARVTELVDGLLLWTRRHGEDAGVRWSEAA